MFAQPPLFTLSEMLSLLSHATGNFIPMLHHINTLINKRLHKCPIILTRILLLDSLQPLPALMPTTVQLKLILVA